MAEDTISPLALNVTRGKPELVTPSEATPREQKPLSDIDDQQGLRYHVPGILFYKANPSMQGKDPIKVVKDALAKALVFFYPLAGRLIEGPKRKLIVDCTGEGVPFIEAEADARLEDFGDEIHPPFPLQELLYDIPGAQGMLGTPLVVIQVTRLMCGGFIVAIRNNHAICDGAGIMQLMNAVGEIARGSTTPSILPAWDRQRLTARECPKVTHNHPVYDQLEHINPNSNEQANQVQHSIFFGVAEIDALRCHVPSHIKKVSTFDILTATLWRCRTIALEFDPKEDVRLSFAVNARNVFDPPLSKGYYGNACAFPMICAKAGDICQNDIGYTLELIKDAKNEINEEYMRSIMDLMVIKDRPGFNNYQSYVISDLRHLGFADVDFGWGRPVFAGVASIIAMPHVSFLVSFKNKKGETMIMLLVSLPPLVMDVFRKELKKMLQVHD